MKIWLDKASGIGGVQRVFEGLYKYLPLNGIEIVSDQDEADVLHAHIGLYHKIPYDKPLVVSSHGLLWEEHGWGRVADKINSLCIEAYRQADVVTVPSQFVAHALSRNMLIKPHIVRHGIDTEEWTPARNGGYVLWNKARVDAANDPAEMDQLASLDTSVTYVSTFGTKTSNVFITGAIVSEEMKKLIRQAGVYLDTSKESGGPCFGVLEAMACGVPVLSWNFGGTPEGIIHKETGYLAEPYNYEDLLEGLHFCLENRNSLGTAARETVIKKYQWKEVIQGYIESYQEALDKQNRFSVGIVVPCYNLGSFLPACLDSVLGQDYQDWKLIVVDDASLDNTLEVAHDYERRDQRIKVVHHTTNRHVSESRNKGISLLDTRYILPLDADDRLAPNALSVMVEALKDRSIDMVSGKLLVFNEGSEQGILSEWPDTADYQLQIQGQNRLCYSSMYRRTVWEKTGGYRRRIRNGVEDADFWTRAMSFGSRAEILDAVTLLYTNRNNSLGKQNTQGVTAWLPWFGWSLVAENTPFGASNLAKAYDLPEVSIVIPVGPGHASHVQGCIDSLLAQTDMRWEAVVVNDTNESIDMSGMPFVTYIDSDKNYGVASARNAGINTAKADKIIFLDVDDIAQPRMVELLIKAHALTGGWVYSDWYTLEGNEPVYHEARDWDINAFRTKMLGPITGLYEKEHLQLVGGFDTKAPGWEDWDMQYKLVEQGICGSRLKYPTFVYNMHLGFRREENFSRAQDLVQYIQNKHDKERSTMACSKCGGKSSVQIKAPTAPSGDNKVLMEYVGPEMNFRNYKSPTKQGVTYRVSNTQPFEIYESDVSHFLSRKNFKVKSRPSTVEVRKSETIFSQLPVEVPLDVLQLSPETRAFIKDYYSTVQQLKAASDSDLLSLKGIGPKRLEEIRKAVG